jgi:hypothetical protein
MPWDRAAAIEKWTWNSIVKLPSQRPPRARETYNHAALPTVPTIWSRSMKQWLQRIGLASGVVLAFAVPSTAQGKQTFTGIVTDSMCADAVHRMRMGSNDAECAMACVAAHDADYVLYDGKLAYVLSDVPTAEKFAGQKVTVTGTLDAKTRKIKVDSMTPAK